MAVHDFNSQRLWLDVPLVGDGEHALSRDQANYVRNVLRLGDGAEILVFNGQDGEWRTRVALHGKRDCVLKFHHQTRPQTAPGPLIYMFAPLKRARLDYMVQKAVEMGVGQLWPVLTRRTVAERVNLDRMRANAIEAAEQCGILSIPEIEVPEPLPARLARWPATVPLVFCDEGAAITDPVAALEALKANINEKQGDGPDKCPVGILIGPEGGFDGDERAILRSKPFVTAISLGPRVMRADTAAVAALALVNAVLGDWS